jgi:hypothetical protein
MLNQIVRFNILLSSFGIFISSLLLYFLNLNFKVYYITYIIYLFMICCIIYNSKSFTKNTTFYFICFFSLFFFTFNLPITIFDNSLANAIAGIKNNYTPFIFALFFMISIKTEDNLYDTLKLLTICGFTSSIYSIVQLLSLSTGKFLLINQISLKYMMNDDNYSQSSLNTLEMFRPSGMLLNFTQNGFFISCAFFAVYLFGHIFFKQKKTSLIFIIVLYAGIIISLSRQIIISFHITIFLIMIIKNRSHNFREFQLKNLIRKISFYILISIISLSFIYISETYTKYIIGIFKFDEGKVTTQSIILNDILNILPNLEYLLLNHPINFFFGFGFFSGTDENVKVLLGLYKELHFFYETLLKFGFFGFIIFWSFFIYQIITLNKAYMTILYKKRNSMRNLFLFGLIILYFTIFQLIHYSPLGISNNIYIGIIFYITLIANKLESSKYAYLKHSL